VRRASLEAAETTAQRSRNQITPSLPSPLEGEGVKKLGKGPKKFLT